MKFFERADWWQLIKETILPHLGTTFLYITIFVSIGLLLGVIYSLILWRFKILKRVPKYYNWAVKLYVVAGIAVFIYFSIHLGFMFAAKSIIKKEEPRIVSAIYEEMASQNFDSPEKRKIFIQKIQEGVVEVQKGSKDVTLSLNKYVASKNTGFNIVDKGKNRLANYIFTRYQNDIYSASVYAMLMVASRGAFDVKDMSYEEFNTLIKALNAMDPRDIEKSIKNKVTEKVDEIISDQMNGMIKGTFYTLIIILLIPVAEFYIYKFWMKNKAGKEELVVN
ncbi:hypothetical protein [Pedobacter punctiformis]|uniref:DUF4199 domain-containing protein n=1 Tax=Pedobacter punctiformis TaxID=3004097 RepID=A0ABT4LES1_9SPHI|nr:hypothetical protein [Pedobacter sp. HCMS5-2]MCZ4245339.1 hypothetical protein [Pedobacter sp. HCMS5-2]